MNKTFFALVGASLALAAGHATAAVSADEAAKLKTTLTPVGAERAGNKDGTIPAWDGGMTKAPAGFVNGGPRPDPFPQEKPLFSITAKNAAQYADKLSEGTRLLLNRSPEYRLDVYPTHRTFAAPQYIYDRTARNAVATTWADSSDGTPMVSNYEGGYPFPVPKTGTEVMTNHIYRWQMDYMTHVSRLYFITAQGKPIMQAENQVRAAWLFNAPTPAPKGTDMNAKVRVNTLNPPISRGQAVVSYDKIDLEQRQLWTYLTGQRRVKMLPNACCDTPSPSTGGAMNFDEVDIFAGSMKLFDWKLVGKKEIYIPYNTNRFAAPPKDADVLTAAGPHPDHVRWELHRVWVVEAALKPGKRHIYPRSVYYIDEDSWGAVQADRWDAQGKLAKSNLSLPQIAPDVPVLLTSIYAIFDHVTGAWFINGVMNETKPQFRRETSIPEAEFNPNSMSGEGMR